MDKKVIFAVAGSGKTLLLVNQLDLDKRTLLVTYTISNLENLKRKVITKFGFMPTNIHLFSYFSFLYAFCFKPFLHHKLSVRGINFKPCPNRYAKGDDRYIDLDRRLYSNRIAKLLELKGVLGDVVSRLSKYCDQILIDEIQDFAGNDFNLLKTIVTANADMMCVGDFFQHTFDTSRDGRVNENLHNEYNCYKEAFRQMGFYIDPEALSKSYRCSPAVCEFVSSKIGIQIESHRDDATEIYFVEEQDSADQLFSNNNVVKLFYQESYKYDCHSKNWGDTKGVDIYGDVCVVLNKTTLQEFKQDNLSELNPQTKNKLYVAITRTRNDLYFEPELLYEKYKAEIGG